MYCNEEDVLIWPIKCGSQAGSRIIGRPQRPSYRAMNASAGGSTRGCSWRRSPRLTWRTNSTRREGFFLKISWVVAYVVIHRRVRSERPSRLVPLPTGGRTTSGVAVRTACRSSPYQQIKLELNILLFLGKMDKRAPFEQTGGIVLI